MTRPPARGPEAESGFATVAVLSVMFVLAAVTGLVVVIGMLGVLRHQAETAADLAALAAAGRVGEGQAAACYAARDIAARQGATIASCALQGGDAVVRVDVLLPGRLAAFGHLSARARAGAR